MNIKYKIVSIDTQTNTIHIKSAPADSSINIDDYPEVAYNLQALDLTQNLEQQIVDLVEPHTVELSTQKQQNDIFIEQLSQMVNQEKTGTPQPLQVPQQQPLVTTDMLQRFMNAYDKSKSGVEQ